MNALLILVSLGIIYAGMETYVWLDVDDGMQFDLEMWRYSRALKRVSSNPRIGHEHRPESSARLMGVDVMINSDGLRDREIPLERIPGTTRITMLGDSLTFGWGVPVDKTYPKRLEQKLRDAGHAVEILNTGVGNYNTAMEVEYFLERGAKYRPDIVVLNYFINDAEPTPRYETNFLNRNFRAYVYFASRFDTALRQADMARQDWQDYYKSLYRPSIALDEVRKSVARLADYCRQHGIRLYLANYPELRVLKDYPFQMVEDFVLTTAQSNDIPYISLLPAVRELEPATLWVTVPDPHPSATAHEAFANELARYFDAELRKVPEERRTPAKL